MGVRHVRVSLATPSHQGRRGQTRELANCTRWRAEPAPSLCLSLTFHRHTPFLTFKITLIWRVGVWIYCCASAVPPILIRGADNPDDITRFDKLALMNGWTATVVSPRLAFGRGVLAGGKRNLTSFNDRPLNMLWRVLLEGCLPGSVLCRVSRFLPNVPHNFNHSRLP